ncbi:MAG: chorismate synthase [Ardenticatenaceae bacterium]|nr:chorismate synthase [Ardenticatenaceae bacterium]
MPLRFLTAGESHGPVLTAILDGLPAGLPLPVEVINQDLARRQQGYGSGPRMKLERDEVAIVGGVMDGVTIGAPLALQVANLNHERWQGKRVAPFTTPRPGHVDLGAAVKYGYRDLRPGLERASARETAVRVAVGAVCRHFLAQFGITIGGYVRSLGEIETAVDDIPYAQRIANAATNDVGCPDPQAVEAMRQRVREIMLARDTLGGIIEVVVLGLPPGLGSHRQWDTRLEARLGTAVLSIQAMKGVEFGDAFANTRLPGTQVHDPILLDGEALVRPSNRAGGLEGGITTGQPLVVRAAMKPIATTLTPQQTVSLVEGKEVPTEYERSDFCPTPRGVVIVEAMIAFVLADALLEKLGGDSLAEMQPRFAALRQARLSDLAMDNTDHMWWP